MKSDNHKELNLLNDIVNSLDIGIIVLDRDLKIIKANKWILSKIKAKEAILNSYCFKAFHQNDRPCPDCPVLKTLESGQESKLICSKLFGEKKDKVYRITSIPIKDNKGEIDFILEKYEDITEQKNTEEELKNNKTKLERVFLIAPTGIGQVKDRKFVDVNHQFSEMTGYTREELIGQNSLMIYPSKEEFEYVGTEKYAQIAKFNTGSVETKFKKKNGEIIDVFMASTPIDVNDLSKGTIFTSLDITQRKKHEKQLLEKSNEYEALNEELKQINEELINAKEYTEENEKKLKNLLGNLKGLAYQCKNDEHWTMFFISQGVKELSGYDVSDIKDNHLISWTQIIHEDYRAYVKTEVNKALKKNKSFTLEYKIKCKDGQEKWVWEKGIAEMKQNKISHIEGFITDITPLKNYEQELVIAKEKAEKANRLKTEFLHNLSHEIRTPMNGIIGFSEILVSPELMEDKRNYIARIIQNSSHQLLRIIDDILEISTLETKQGTIRDEAFDLNDLLMELFSIFNLKAKERNISLFLKKAFLHSQSQILSDKTKLFKILSNLIENALKFTNEGYIEIGYYLENNLLNIYVKDTGIGIAPENRSIIFERFSQENNDISRNHGGLGLGLSISKENAQLLGGNITLMSEKGKGSTFCVSIPYKPVHKEKSSSKVISNNTPENKPTFILVAEDEEVNYFYLEALFENKFGSDFKLIHAKNGKEAVDICLENKNIDIVLMDIKMPVLNGHEAAKIIKSRYPGLPILAQTAYSTESDKELALKSGCDDFISKPINTEKLFALIKKYTNK